MGTRSWGHPGASVQQTSQETQLVGLQRAALALGVTALQRAALDQVSRLLPAFSAWWAEQEDPGSVPACTAEGDLVTEGKEKTDCGLRKTGELR